MLQYVLTIEARGMGDASNFFRLIREALHFNLDTEEVSSLERAVNNPHFVKDLKVRISSSPAGWCFITKEGPFGPLKVNFYTPFGAMSQSIKSYINDITKRLSASGFSIISQYYGQHPSK